MERPRIYEHVFRVPSADIDRLGHVNNVVYLRYAQDVAVAHWKSAVPKEQRDTLVWVVRRHEIDYLKPAVADDELLARTWVGEASGATMDRFIEIHRPGDGELLVRVRSVWVALDPATMRPRRVTDAIRAYFDDEPS